VEIAVEDDGFFLYAWQLGDEISPETNSHSVGPGTGLQLRQQVAHMRLHGLLREEEPHADLAVHEAVGDQLEHLDLARRRLLLELLERAGERDDVCAFVPAALRNRVEAATVVHVAGEDLLALGSIHGNRGIGLATAPL